MRKRLDDHFNWFWYVVSIGFSLTFWGFCIYGIIRLFTVSE